MIFNLPASSFTPAARTTRETIYTKPSSLYLSNTPIMEFQLSLFFIFWPVFSMFVIIFFHIKKKKNLHTKCTQPSIHPSTSSRAPENHCLLLLTFNVHNCVHKNQAYMLSYRILSSFLTTSRERRDEIATDEDVYEVSN